MGREVRKVPANWHHPYDKDTGSYKPLFPGKRYAEKAKEFIDLLTNEGLQTAIDEYGQPPDMGEYMPDWTESECTHYMMYEDTSEGTPISPAFATPEELARWLTDNKASAFANQTASYENWLAMINQGWSVSAVFSPQTGLISGVEAASALKQSYNSK